LTQPTRPIHPPISCGRAMLSTASRLVGMGLAPLLAVVLVFPAVARAEDPPASAVAVPAEDDECQADGGEGCALSALQRARRSLRAQQQLASLEPDFTLISDDAGDMDDAEDEDTEDEEDAVAQPILAANLEASVEWVHGVDKAPVTGCHGANGKKCPSGETCVTKFDGTFSQCVDCGKEQFGKECQKLDDYMRYAAIHTCKQTCEDSRCFNHNWCFKPHKCVVDKANNWGQCIDCRKSAKFWKYSCATKSKTFLEAAHHVCHKKCHP